MFINTSFHLSPLSSRILSRHGRVYMYNVARIFLATTKLPIRTPNPPKIPIIMHEGASHSEQLLECARRNNTELLSEIGAQLLDNDAALGQLINTTKEAISGNGPLHIATMLGNWDVLDQFLDVPGVEIDPLNRENSTPLHLAVKYASDEPELGLFIADNLLDAGSDAKAMDKYGLKPSSYVKDNQKLLELLRSAEYATHAPIVLVVEENGDEDDEESASDSE